MPAADGVFSDAAIAERFASFRGAKAIGLAVSGGPDSVALLLLVARWRRMIPDGPRVVVFTVDHGLRPESAAEAESVATIAAAHGFAHSIRRWDAPKPSSGIEAAARAARYELLGRACHEHGVADLLTAHHRDDQSETILMRLGRGSAVSGLAGMSRSRKLERGVVLHRPLLDLPKGDLLRVVKAAGIATSEDPMNADLGFDRPKLRRLAPALFDAGISSEGIARAAERAGRADRALDQYTDRFMQDAVTVDAFGAARLERGLFAGAPEEIRIRALGRLVSAVAGQAWPPVRMEKLEALEVALQAGAPLKRSIAGAIVAAGSNAVTFVREVGRMVAGEVPVTPGASGLWDGRFAYRVDTAPQGLSIGPLGNRPRAVPGIEIPRIPRSVLAALPAFRVGDRLVAVPSLGYRAEAPEPVTASVESVLAQRLFRPAEGNPNRSS